MIDYEKYYLKASNDSCKLETNPQKIEEVQQMIEQATKQNVV